MIIDVTHVLLGDVRPGGRGGGKVAQLSIREWLEENVGPYYGTEKDAESDRDIGSGWEFGASCESDDKGNLKIGWIVDVADEKLALMFTLRFG